MALLERRYLKHLLRRNPVDVSIWRETVAANELIRRLDSTERARLRVLTTRFLYEKRFSGAAGLEPSASMKVTVAALACLLILNLRWQRFGGWREIILYPGGFRVRRERLDAAGIMHQEQQELCGEAWQKGAVILSWDDVRQDFHDPENGGEWYAGNVVLHEFAHKLDMQNGHTNGMPPLHPDMLPANWTAALSEAYAHLQYQVDRGEPTAIDPYGATDPAEFFAVTSEVFFVQPWVLDTSFPGVYAQLRRFYRQNPLQRYH